MGRLYTILLILALLAGGCAHKQADTVLVKAENFMDQHPDSALNLLKNLTFSDFSSSAYRAKYSLLYSQALDKNYIDLASDSIIGTAVRYYEKRGNSREKAMAYYYLARIYQNAGEIDPTIKYLIRAKEEVIRTQDDYLSALINHCLGVLYSEQYSFDEALPLLKKAAAAYSRTNKKENECNTYLSIGKNFFLQEKKDSALFYYNKAKEISLETNNFPSLALINSKIANLIANKGKIDSSKIILRKGYLKYNKGKIPVEDYPLWSFLFFQENNLDSARHYALLAYEKTKKLSLNKKAGIIALLEQIETKSNNLSLALKYNNRYILLKDSINRQEKANLIQQAEQKYKNEVLQTSYSRFRTKHRYQIAVISLTIIVGLFLSLAVILRLRKARREAIREKNRELEAQKEFIANLNENYADMKDQYHRLLENFNKEDERETEFFKAFETRMAGLEELMDLAYISEGNTATFYRSFKKYINNFNRKDHSFYDLQYMVNKKYNGIIDYLKEHYPALSKSDLDLFSMICFGFSLNSIRFIYNHNNIESLYNKRGKLKSKLGLPAGTNINTFIRELNEKLSQKE